jgi:hypothetical protein
MLWHVVQRGCLNFPANDWLNALVSTSCEQIPATKTSVAALLSLTKSRLSGVPEPSAFAASDAVVNATSTMSRSGNEPIAGTTTPVELASLIGFVGCKPMSKPTGRFVLTGDVSPIGDAGLLPRPLEQLATAMAAPMAHSETRKRAFIEYSMPVDVGLTD